MNDKESYTDIRKMNAKYLCAAIILLFFAIALASILIVMIILDHNPVKDVGSIAVIVTACGVISSIIISSFQISDERKARLSPNVFPHIINHGDSLMFTLKNLGPGVAYEIKLQKDDKQSMNERSQYIYDLILEMPFLMKPIGCLPCNDYLGDTIARLNGDEWIFGKEKIKNEELINCELYFIISFQDCNGHPEHLYMSMTMGSYLHKDQYNPKPDVAICNGQQTADDAPQSD